MRFEILGPLRVHDGSREVTIASGREGTLLAVLLLHANRTVPFDRLVEAIWDDRAPRGARNQLQGCVSRLRRRLLAPDGTTHVIHTDQAGYRVAVETHQLDLLEFRRLVTQARAATAAGDHADALDRYRAAEALWRGPALTGTDISAVQGATTALDEEGTQALEERVDLEIAAGAAGQLVSELTVLVVQHPHREGLHRALMLALYRAGRQADALAAYRHVRQLLHDDLGTEPGPELQRLHQAILSRDPELDLPPERVPPRPARASQFSVPRELPTDLARFTGRIDVIDALDELVIDSPDSPLAPVLITGTAGVGKTTLALHWAHRVAGQFPDGQLYLDLQGHASGAPLRPVDALPVLLRSLGTPPEQIPADAAEAAARYRSCLAGRRVLVVLDNAASADQVRALLPGSPGSLVLATSRNRLTGLIARDGARVVQLDVFTPDEAESLLSHILGAARVHAEPEAAAALSAACAHLALALGIAAAHLAQHPHRTIASYVAEMKASDALTTLQVADDHESVVRGAFDLSYRAIPADAKRMFRLLGLVPGADFTAPAAAALAGTAPAVATLSLRQLVSASLIGERTPGRFSFHDLLRQYARQLVDSDEGDDERAAAAGRLLDAYLVTSDAAANLLHPQMLRLPLSPTDAVMLTPLDDGASALAWLDAERTNLVAAVALTAENGLEPLSWCLSDRLRGYFWHGRHTTDWLSVASAGLRAAERVGDAQARAAAHFNLAHFHQSSAHHEDAIAHYTAAVDLARQAAWTHCQAAALTNVGMVYQDIGRPHESADHHASALALNSSRGDLGWQAVNLVNLGFVNRLLGNLQNSADNLTQALAVNRDLAYRHGEAAASGVLGMTYCDLGRFDEALDLLTNAARLYRETGDWVGETTSLHGLAVVQNVTGHHEDAADLARQAVTQADDLGDSRCKADALNALGGAQLSLGGARRALGCHQDALDLARQVKVRYPATVALVGLAAAHYREAENEQAADAANQAILEARETGYRVLEGQAMNLLAEILLGQQRYGAGRDHANRALDLHRQTATRLGEAQALAVLGQLQFATDGPRAAQAACQAAHDLFIEMGVPPPENLARQLKAA